MSDDIDDGVINFTPRQILPAGTLTTLCVQFLKGLQNRGYMLNTLKGYRCDLEKLGGVAA